MMLPMSASRLISYPAHGAVEFVLGVALMALPFLLGAQPAGIVVGVGLGATVCAIALTSIGADGRTPGAVAVSAHQAYDQGIALGGVGAALVLALAGQATIAVGILAVAASLFLLSLVTRYSAR